MDIKIVPHKCITASGLAYTYGVLINGYPKYVFNSNEQLQAFLDAVEPKIQIKKRNKKDGEDRIDN